MVDEYNNIFYFIPQKIKINLTQPGNEKIIKIFTSSISNYSFLLTKLNHKIKIYGFGDNKHNNLGIFEKDNEKIFIPTKINFLKKSKIKNIFCGCMHTFVLEKNNTLFGFGRDFYGQSGKKINTFFQNKNEKIKKISLNKESTIFLTSFFIFYFLFF